MPKQTTTSKLMSKMGAKAKQAHTKHKDEEIKLPGGGSLPDGIENGRAQLVECKIGTYEKGDMKGELFFRAAGVIIAPETHDGIRVKGKQTSIMEPLCDTPNRSRATFDEHYAWMLNQLKMLGLPVQDIDADDIEAAMETLKDSAPIFGFRTWKGEKTPQFPNPRVNEVWEGIDTDFVPEEISTDVVDNTEDTSDETEQAEEEVPFGDPQDELDELVEKAITNEDEAAQNQLTKLAKDAGASKKEIEEAESWDDVAKLVRFYQETNSDTEQAAETAEESTAEWKPEAGEIYLYKLPGKKNQTEVEIVAVNEKSRTVTIKDCDSEKTINDPKTKKAKAVSWDDLQGA